MQHLMKDSSFLLLLLGAVLLFSYVVLGERSNHQFLSAFFPNALPKSKDFVALALNLKRRLQVVPLGDHEQQASTKIFLKFLETPSAGKLRNSLVKGAFGSLVVVSNTTEQQYEFLRSSALVEGAAERFQLLMKSNHYELAEELWKYCALWQDGGIYLDAQIQVLNPLPLKEIIAGDSSRERDGVAVLMDTFAPMSVYGSLLLFRDAKSKVALEMAKLIVETNISTLMGSPLLLPHTLHDLIHNSESNGGWHLLLQSCSESPFQAKAEDYTGSKGTRSLYKCSPLSGLCCFVYSDNEESRVAILGSRKPMQPNQVVNFSGLPEPMQPGSTPKGELPFISTIRTKENPKPPAEQQAAPFKTFYELLQERECLPSHSCNKCLGDKKHGATCETCMEECTCYCKALCEEDKDPSAAKNLQYQEVKVRKPGFSRDPTRLIPRKIHQTWFEHLDPEKYPNMSRLTESFKTSGWAYSFYTDEKAGEFLSENFPPQVRQAYDLLVPGAFKADLFRYCCLLIYGGVYADVDTLLGPFLDSAIPPDAGFVVGLDEPGKRIGKGHCVWNGFLAATPGHPFLAKVIETVVNNIHQRFTSVDVARTFCPLPEMSIITSFSPLFVAGPCMLGSIMNKVLGRHGQAPIEAGTLSTSNASIEIPGRIIILHQNKLDMGAHRFTSLEQNLIVLSTDFPESDDREKLDGYEHYSETRVRFTTYGTEGVYKDNHRNNTALIRVIVE